MKKVSAVVVLVLSLCLVVSLAVAAETTMKGTIKKVDDKAGAITFSQEGAAKDEVLAVDKSVDLKDVKANMKAQITVEGGVVKGIKAEARPKAPGY